MSIRLVLVPPSHIEAIWPRLDALYEAACKHSHGTLTKEVVFYRAVSGNCSLWISADSTDTEVTASCITSEVDFPGGTRFMFVELIGGRLEGDIFDFRSTLERQAAQHGCSGIFFITPRKWVKSLPEYRKARYLMFKDLTGNVRHDDHQPRPS